MANAVNRLAIAALILSVFVSTAVIPRVEGQQAQAPPPWMQLTIVQVNPAMIDEYIAAQRDVTARLRRGSAPPALTADPSGGGGRGSGGAGGAAGPNWRIVSRSEIGDTYRFLTATPVQTLASFDAAARNTDAELNLLGAKALKYVTGQRSYIIRNMPEIDNPLPTTQAPNLMVINFVKVAPGREQDYFNLMKSEFFPHFDKANVSHLTGSVVFGGEAGFVHQYFYNNFAALDAGSPVVKALGAAGAQAVTAKLAGIVVSSEQWIARTLPELSFGPWSPPAKQ